MASLPDNIAGILGVDFSGNVITITKDVVLTSTTLSDSIKNYIDSKATPDNEGKQRETPTTIINNIVNKTISDDEQSIVFKPNSTPFYIPVTDTTGANFNNSIIFQLGGKIGINTTSPKYLLDIYGGSYNVSTTKADTTFGYRIDGYKIAYKDIDTNTIFLGDDTDLTNIDVNGLTISGFKLTELTGQYRTLLVDDNGLVSATDEPEAVRIKVKVRNSTGAAITRGKIVYMNGSTGNRPTITLAKANAESTSSRTFGAVLNDIPNNTDGYVVVIGNISTLDTRVGAPNPFTTDTLVDGDQLYLSPTDFGYVTNVKPSAPNHIVYIGKVIRTSPTNGTIEYQIMNGFELDEIHDVKITSKTNKDFIYYDGTSALWKNAQFDSIMTIGGEVSGIYSNIILSEAAILAKKLTGLSTATGGSIVAADTIIGAFGKIQSQLNSLQGSLIYKGTWNASTNTPTITSGVGTKGNYYIVSTAGTTNIDGTNDWGAKDWIVFNGTTWDKIDNTDSVISVNGNNGIVNLTTSDIPEAATPVNKYFTDARATAAMTGAISSVTTANLTANRALISDGGGKISVSTVTSTELGYVSGVTSSIQTQLNNKQPLLTNPITGTGVANQIAYFNGTTSLTSSSIFTIDTSTNKISINGGLNITLNGSNDSIISLQNSATNVSYLFFNGNGYNNSVGMQSNNGQFFINNSGGSLFYTQLGKLIVPSSVSASSFIKSGGTSSQYLMADGSVSTLTNPITGSGTTNYLPKFTGSTTLGNSLIYDNGTNVGIGTSTPNYGGWGANAKVTTILGSASATSVGALELAAHSSNVSSGNVIGSIAYILTANTSAKEVAFLRSNIEGSTAGNQGANLSFWTKSDNASVTQKMVINGLGNLGLGVTPSAWSGSKAFQLTGGAIRSDGANLDITQNAYVGSTGWTYYGTGKASHYQQYAGSHEFYVTNTSGTAGQAITFTQAMTLDASGNLMVGTTSALLSTGGRGNITINGSSSSILTLGVGGGYSGYFYADATKVELSTNAQPMTFVTNGAERFRINSNGTVSIGNTNNTYKLDVSGTGYFNDKLIVSQAASAVVGLEVKSTNATSYNSTLFYGTTVDAGTANYNFIGMYANGVAKFLVNGLGAATFSSTITATSATLKNNSSTPTYLVLDGTNRTSPTAGRIYEIGTGYAGVGNEKFYIYDNTANVSRLVINDTGNVGIGTTSPISPLTVKSQESAARGITILGRSDSISTLRFFNSAGTTEQGGLISTSTYLGFTFADTERMRITSSGAVGIATNNPTGIFQVAGSGNIFFGDTPSNTNYKFNVKGFSGNYISFWTPTLSGVNQNGIMSHSGAGLGAVTPLGYYASTHIFGGEVTGGGLVQVAGDVNISGAFKVNGNPIGAGSATSLSALTDVSITSPSNGQILVYDSSTSRWKNINNTASGVTGNGTANYLSKWTGTTSISNSVIYDNGTNVGFGTTGPAYKIDVVGDVNVTGTFRVGGMPIGTGGASSLGGLTDVTLTSPINAGQVLVYNGSKWVNQNGSITITSPATAGKLTKWATGTSLTDSIVTESGSTLTASGTITANAFYEPSDIRLKNIIEQQGDVIRFTWKDGRDNSIHIGYIAQEMQKLYPNQVILGENGYLSVNYTEILVDKVARLEKRVKELENKLGE